MENLLWTVKNCASYLITVFLVCFTIHGILCYNVEVIKVGKFKGESGSQFGYSVALVRSPGGGTRQTLLVGAPNLTYNGMNGHGQVSLCRDPEKHELNCQWMNLSDVYDDMCGLLRKTGCAEEGRLSTTLVVNRNYDSARTDSPTAPKITICAPGWKNKYPENDTTRYQNYMVGMCLKLDANLSQISCNIKTERSYCWPFWAGRDTSTDTFGRPVYTYAQGGFSATFTQDGQSEVIGGPGAYDWRGAYIAQQKGWMKRPDDFQGKTIYFAYSLATGKLDASVLDAIVSGIPNFYVKDSSGHFGKFDTYKNGDQKSASVEYGVPQNCDGQIFDLRGLIDLKQEGTKFGASLATVDLNGDGFHEVVVGAPLYSGTNPEEGRVFVYTFKDGKPCGPIGVFSGVAKHHAFAKKSAFARFGSTIASAGDLDIDGYNDVAIGAPYEDDGHGAVYIYRGAREIPIPDVFSQRISGNDIDAGIRSFGWSIYGEEDVDDNGFPDLAVGAYKSDTAVVFRSRPIVDISVEMKISPNPVPLNASSLNCSLDREQLCFSVTVSFRYKSIIDKQRNVDSIMLTWTMDTDTVYKRENSKSRVEFRGGQSNITENITLNHNVPLDKIYTLDVRKYKGKPEPQDAWTKVKMEGSYIVVPSSGSDFTRLDPILQKNSNSFITENAEFDKNCDNLNECTSDLVLKVELFLLKQDGTSEKVQNNTELYVGAANELEVTADVKNVLDSSYRANLNGEVTAVMRRDISSNNGVTGASCKYDSKTTLVTNVSCSADSKLDLNENFKIKAYFDITPQRLVPEMDISKMKPNISITFRADQANTDVKRLNNEFRACLFIMLKYDVKIEEEAETANQLRYKADEKSSRKIKLVHQYFIINNGPSFLPSTYVNVSIPIRLLNVAIAVLEEYPSTCVRRESQNKETTTQIPLSTSRRDTIIPPEAARRRRQLEKATAETGSQTNKENIGASKAKQTVRNITCEDISCDILECRIDKLGENQMTTVTFVIELYEKELANMKDVREIRYQTKAVVTDPSVWFGEQVVPFEQTKYAEKWTTFVVEPESVVSEISIWIIIGSVLGAVALLIIIVIILWRCGFFKRKKHSQVQEWKRSSLYKTKSVRSSTNSKQPFSPLSDKDNDASG